MSAWEDEYNRFILPYYFSAFSVKLMLLLGDLVC
jgi:hypothetical protein